MRSHQTIALAIAGFFMLAPATHAATFCVNNAGALQTALDMASNNGETNTIKVSSGTYLSPTNGFRYFRTSGTGALDIEGGWNAGCAVQTPDAALTILDGQANMNVLSVVDSSGLGVVIRYFTVLHGGSMVGVPAFQAGSHGEVHVDNCRFRLNDLGSNSAGVIYVNAVTGPLYFTNNVVANNGSPTAGSPVAIDLGAGATDVTFYINNNTIADNMFDTTSSSSGALFLSPSSAAHSSLANNILWGNGGNEFAQNITIMPLMLNNDVDVLNVTPAAGSSGNLGVNPHFVSVTNHHLLSSTQLYNAGYTAPPGGYGVFDLDGNPRVALGVVDIGAYELQTEPDEIFLDGFDGA
ncbi:MAG: hypothetical protein ABIS07_09465 [Dokdonella sp.]